MTIERSPSLGSMFACVDSLHNLSTALQEILGYLPDDSEWPTIQESAPFSAYAEWGQRNSVTGKAERGAVWIHATPEGVKMNTDFRPNWPECGASDFDAKIAAGWLLELTKNWKWDASRSADGITRSSLSRPGSDG